MTGEKKAKKELLIIIPAYNEANNITKLLEKLESPEIAEIADVLIMNDASSDDTNWIVKARNHAIVTHVFNLGYGSALQLGYKYAIRRGYEYVIQMDADGQHDVCNIPVIYEKLKTKDENGNYPDIVLGSRFINGDSSYKVGFAKKIAFKLFRTIIKIGTGRKFYDPTTGLQGLSRRAVLYYSKYNHFDDKLMMVGEEYFQDVNVIYFSSMEKADEAIEQFKDELLWYFTEYVQRLDEAQNG